MTSIPVAHPVTKPAPPGAPHEPYIPPSQAPAELTLRAIVLGVILGLIFGASNVYLALKIGLTVSASIPIAVLSITIFRWLGRSTILENNIVQTTGSAADSVSAGVVFTIPAILLMGYDLDISRVTILAIAGGLMGVLMMIPLRRSPHRRGARRYSRQDGVPGIRHRIRLQVPHDGLEGVARVSREGAPFLPGRRGAGGGESRADRRRVHHRTAHRWIPVRRRVPRVRRADAGHQAVWQRDDGADVRDDEADPRHECGRDPRGVRVLYRRRCRGERRHHRAGALTPHHRLGVPSRICGHARQPAWPGGGRQAPHR